MALLDLGTYEIKYDTDRKVYQVRNLRNGEYHEFRYSWLLMDYIDADSGEEAIKHKAKRK